MVARANGDKSRSPQLRLRGAEATTSSKTRTIKLRNNGSRRRSSTSRRRCRRVAAHGDVNKTSVTVPAKGDAEVQVTLSVPVATAGASRAFREVAGLVAVHAGAAAGTSGVALRVPYYLVPRACSRRVDDDRQRLRGTDPSDDATVTNKSGAIAGDADFYAWGLERQEREQARCRTTCVRSACRRSFVRTTTQPVGRLRQSTRRIAGRTRRRTSSTSSST